MLNCLVEYIGVFTELVEFKDEKMMPIHLGCLLRTMRMTFFGSLGENPTISTYTIAGRFGMLKWKICWISLQVTEEEYSTRSL